jgi:hypothetical protein
LGATLFEDYFLASTPFITKFARTPQKTRNRTPLHSSVSTQISKPCHSIPFHGTLYPPNICRAKRCATTESFLSCRVACSQASHTTPPGLLLLGHTLPRSSDPVTATPRPPSCTAVTALAPTSPRPSARADKRVTSLFTPRSGPRAYPGHVPRPTRRHGLTVSSCRGAIACPPGSRNGTGLVATHPPRTENSHRPAPSRDRSR